MDALEKLDKIRKKKQQLIIENLNIAKGIKNKNLKAKLQLK